MKKILLTYFLLSFSSQLLFADEFIPTLLKLTPILKEHKYQGNYDTHQNDNYFEATKIYKADERVQVTAFLKPKTAEIKQLTILTKYCNFSKVDKKLFTIWSQSQIKTLYKAFFHEDLPRKLLSSDQFVSTSLSKSYRKIRVSKGSYKCDAKGGDGVILKFFF